MSGGPMTDEHQVQVRRRHRKPSLAAAIKQARKAGVDVQGATVRPDGSVSLTFGHPAESNVAGNPWDGAVDDLLKDRRKST
jgi:hypothetical protein